MQKFVMVLAAFAALGCNEMSSMPDTDARIRDMDPNAPDNDFPEPEPDVSIVDAEVIDAARPVTCSGAIIGGEELAPRADDIGCGCFHSEVPPRILSCRSPSHTDCYEAGGDLIVSDVPGGGCRHECDLDKDGVPDWQVTYNNTRTDWWIGEEPDDTRTIGVCNHGWSVYIIEGADPRFEPSTAEGDRMCICWGESGGIVCPPGCTPPTRPLCDPAEFACDGVSIGDECGVTDDGSTPCDSGSDCRFGTCQSNPTLGFRKACCI